MSKEERAIEKNEKRDKYEKIIDLAVRRGFFWVSYEIYGGVAGLYDLGPLGALLKRRIVDLWRRIFVQKHQEYVVEIETPTLTPEKVLIASGHVEHFTDPIVECLKCGRKYRADHLIKESTGLDVEGLSTEELTRVIREKNIRCPACGGELSEVKKFSLLFKTNIGPYSDSVGYIRPEAAQGMFTAFKRVYEAMRNKFPIGIAQIGRVGRNEISPRQGMIRLREFTIMEIEFFFDPKNPECPLLDRVADKRLRILRGEDKIKGVNKPESFKVEEAVREKIIRQPWQAYWMSVAQEFISLLGVNEEDTYFEEKLPHERAHYAEQVFDQMVRVSRWGWVEVSGHAYRTDYDLSRHQMYSGADLTIFRKYSEPIIVKRRRIYLDKSKVLKIYGSKAPEIFRELEKEDLERLMEKAKEEDTYYIIGDKRYPKEIFKIEDFEEKIYGERILPHVVEPSFGAERLLYIALEHSYSEDGERVYLKLPRVIAPIQIAIFPLVEEDHLIKIAREIKDKLIDAGFYIIYDESGSIGRRYARADEIGVPYAITVDYETPISNTVTVRDRDTRSQERIPIEKLIDYFKERFTI
ncbi:MAG: glycine--tRNA ligase [Sulfolobales archaeon]